MRAAFYTLGCKVNQYETQVLTQQFASGGYEIVDSSAVADVYVVNSCTVTAMGDKKTRQAIRHFKRQSPGAVVALIGCFPQAFPQEAGEILEADIIMGAGDKQALLGLVDRFLGGRERIIQIAPHQKKENFEAMKADSFVERTRAFIKIQDGCEHFCSYCIIPFARGFNRSKPLEALKAELSDLSARGFTEAVLVGIDLSSYGKDFSGGESRLVDAVALACSVEGIERVRLGSLEPLMLTDQNLDILASLPEFCPQFHLSLQSGCDETLRRMNRHYNTGFYRGLVEKIRRRFSNPAITTDIMVGFPGETDEEFAESLAFAEEISFAKVHVFAYSVRPGTRAEKLPNQVTPDKKESRSHKMSELTEKTRLSFLATQVGKTETVLFENNMAEGCYTGYTKNYTPVWVKADGLPNLRKTAHDVEIFDTGGEGCMGRLVNRGKE